MFSGWLGKGKVLNAIQLERPGMKKKLIDRVQATVLYDSGTVNFYHGFDQPTVLDRQELRLHFERGEITLYEWVPVKMKLHGLLQKKDIEKLFQMMPGLTILSNDNLQGNIKVKGRFTDIIFDDHLTIEYGNKSEKQERYQQILTTMLQDQWDWIKDHEHVRVVDDINAVESTRMAEQATQIAKNLNLAYA